jgi:hypothetical protein
MARPGGIANAEARKMTVSAAEVQSKMSDKNEIFRFLTAEAGIFLDDYKVHNIYQLRAILNGSRKHLKSKDVRHIHVPCFESLSISKMLDWA